MTIRKGIALMSAIDYYFLAVSESVVVHLTAPKPRYETELGLPLCVECCMASLGFL